MAVPPILWNRFCWLDEKMVGWDRRRKTLSISRPLLALTSMSETSFNKLLSELMCYKSGRCPIFGCLLSFRQFVQTSQSYLMIVHISPISRWHPPVIQTCKQSFIHSARLHYLGCQFFRFSSCRLCCRRNFQICAKNFSQISQLCVKIPIANFRLPRYPCSKSWANTLIYYRGHFCRHHIQFKSACLLFK